MAEYTNTQLHKAMMKGLDEGGLKQLCLYLNDYEGLKDIRFDQLGKPLTQGITDLINFCTNRNKRDVLISVLRDEFPGVASQAYNVVE